MYNKKDICTLFDRVPGAVRRKRRDRPRPQTLHLLRSSSRFKILLDLANAEQDQPVSSGAATLPHSLRSKTCLDQAFVPCRQSRARRRPVACLFPLYESAEVTTMGPLKVSDMHCTLLLAAEPYGDFGGRRMGRGLRCAEDSGGTVNTRQYDHRRLWIGIAWSKLRGRRCKNAHVRDCACSRLVDVHLAKESARLPLKSVGLRTAVLSTHPLHNCCDLRFTINHQHPLQQSYNQPTS